MKIRLTPPALRKDTVILRAGLFDFIKNIIPKGTVVGNLLGSTREKGTGFLGINIGPQEYQAAYKEKATAQEAAMQTSSETGTDKNVMVTGLLIILAGFLLFTTFKK